MLYLYDMGHVNYSALVASGEIETFSELMSRLRQDCIETYHSKDWPDYKPRLKDKKWKNIYRLLSLDEIMEFGQFISVMKAIKKADR